MLVECVPIWWSHVPDFHPVNHCIPSISRLPRVSSLSLAALYKWRTGLPYAFWKIPPIYFYWKVCPVSVDRWDPFLLRHNWMLKSNPRNGKRYSLLGWYLLCFVFVLCSLSAESTNLHLTLHSRLWWGLPLRLCLLPTAVLLKTTPTLTIRLND